MAQVLVTARINMKEPEARLGACAAMAAQDPQQPTSEPDPLLEVANNPRYQQLVRERSRFSWTLTIIMLVIFFGYMLLIAFAPELLGRRIGGGTTTIGIPIGIGVILSGILLTGIYVHRANSRFDPLIAEVVEESER
ncbi:DUF485 domain-containing protein [Sphingomonas sp.]|uniref:DUF485 domain-containing protein n=1 Tax=Sphingomonas sp. TaxID=28214 RepID=UPI0025D6D6E5|nr:DUF485 domain-containing protein [Sphingomonas sp.]